MSNDIVRIEYSKVPDDYERTDELMSNFDHSVNKNVEREMLTSKKYSSYPAYNFFGKVWYENGLWYCEVWVYGSHRGTVTGDSPEDIMNTLSNQYGQE